MSQVRNMQVNINSLSPPTQSIRGVSLDDHDMVLLADSIEKNDLLVPLTVCDGKIVDGYRRWLCCRAAGFDRVPIHEVEGDPDILRVITQTRATHFDRTDKRNLLGSWLQRDRSVTVGEVAHTFNWSTADVESLAGITYLIPEALDAYNRGELTLAEIWQLSRLPEDCQSELLDEDLDDMYNRAEQALRAEKSSRRRAVTMRRRSRKFYQILRERETLNEAGLNLIRADAKSALDGWKACLSWVINDGK